MPLLLIDHKIAGRERERECVCVCVCGFQAKVAQEANSFENHTAPFKGSRFLIFPLERGVDIYCSIVPFCW